MLSHASLKNNKHLNILSSQLNRRKEINKSESQDLTPSSRDPACGTRRGGWGCASILSAMPNAAPDTCVCTCVVQVVYTCVFMSYISIGDVCAQIPVCACDTCMCCTPVCTMGQIFLRGCSIWENRWSWAVESGRLAVTWGRHCGWGEAE